MSVKRAEKAGVIRLIATDLIFWRTHNETIVGMIRKAQMKLIYNKGQLLRIDRAHKHKWAAEWFEPLGIGA